MTAANASGTQQNMLRVLQIDCLGELTTTKLMQDVPNFAGAEVIFLDLPKVSLIDQFMTH